MFKKQSENRGTLTAIIDESVSGMKTVKAFSQEETMRGRFRAANENLRLSALKAIFFSSHHQPGDALRQLRGVRAGCRDRLAVRDRPGRW